MASGRLARAAGQRNILVYMYLEVDPGLVHHTLRQELDALEAFAAAVLELMEDGEG